MGRIGIRTFGVAACTAAVLGMGATAASAGEITGNGTAKPPVGKSVCAFSGLNDGYFDGTEAERVQSFGQIVRFAGPMGGVPGTACNPNRGFEE